MPLTTTNKTDNSTAVGGNSPAITPRQDIPPELLRELSNRGIGLDSIPDPGGVFVGISHASGPSENQDEIDAWIDAGGIPDFEGAQTS